MTPPMEHKKQRQGNIMDHVHTKKPNAESRPSVKDRYWSQFDFLVDDAIDVIISHSSVEDYLVLCRAWSNVLLRGVLRRVLHDAQLRNVALNTRQADSVLRFLAGQSLFLTGMGGSGKSFVLRLIVGIATSALGKDAVRVCATTSPAAAELMRSGIQAHVSTVHSLVNARQCIDENGQSVYDPDPPKELQNVRLVVVDEVSMLSSNFFDCLVESVHPECQVVASGDLLQLQPVNAIPVFRSERFTLLRVVELIVNVRACGEGPIAAQFRDIQKRLRLGRATWEDMTWLLDNSMQEEVKDAALFAKNAACHLMNRTRFSDLDAPAICICAVDELQTQQWRRPDEHEEGAKRFSVVRCYAEPMRAAIENNETEYERRAHGKAPPLTRREKDALSPPTDCEQEIELKVGLRVVLTRAIWEPADQNAGVASGVDDGGRQLRTLVAANGDTGTVVYISETEVRVAFQKYGDDVDNTNEVVVRRVPYKKGCRVCSRTLLQRVWVRRQYPLQIGYARTVHKAQGATLCQPTHMDANNVLYRDGKAPRSIIYTMISRARCVSQIHFARNKYDNAFDPRNARPDPYALAYHTDATKEYSPLQATLLTLGLS